VSSDSLTGQAGPEALAAAKALLTNHLVHLIASDAHSPFVRGPRLSEALVVASSLVGKEKAWLMVSDIPRAVIEGTELPKIWEPHRPARWRRMFLSGKCSGLFRSAFLIILRIIL
jgi:protein-tyrosine phosphatase